jgi:hypothetical protein
MAEGSTVIFELLFEFLHFYGFLKAAVYGGFRKNIRSSAPIKPFFYT